MINIDQLELLEEKVETAVQKIRDLTGQLVDAQNENLRLKAGLDEKVQQLSQLNEENAALRAQCDELTNALSAKTELVTDLEAKETKIEKSIISALNTLDGLEEKMEDSIKSESSSFDTNFFPTLSDNNPANSKSSFDSFKENNLFENDSSSFEKSESNQIVANHAGENQNNQNDFPVENEGLSGRDDAFDDQEEDADQNEGGEESGADGLDLDPAIDLF